MFPYPLTTRHSLSFILQSTVSRAQTRSDRLSEIRTKLAALDEIAGNTARKELDQSLEGGPVMSDRFVPQTNVTGCLYVEK